MPGIYQFSLDRLSEEMDEVASLGIKSVLLFGIPVEKMNVEQALSMIMGLFKKRHDLLRRTTLRSLWWQIHVFVNIQAMVIVE